MSNIQKLNRQLAEQGVVRSLVAGGIAAPVDNREPLTVGLVQINNSFSGQNYLPYAAGLLQTYVQRNTRHPDRYTFCLPLYCRVPVRKALEHLMGANVIGFSTYVWNIRISLEIARQIKERRPETLIVFGGPQVPDRAEEFLRANAFIDLAVHGEGEPIFLGILENFPSCTWTDIPSISYLRPDGQFVFNQRAERLKDISVIPSPYLEGVFEPLMQANLEEKWLILWETNRGCPFRCTFCDWGSAIAAKVSQFDQERLLREVDWFAKNKIEFIFCCDANYGMLGRDYDITRYVVDTKQRLGYPKALSVQNTKNGTERAYKVQKLLSDAGLNKGVAISLQSVDPQTLEAIKRENISTESYQELQRRFTHDRVETYSDLILGLPGETYESFINGLSSVVESGQHNRIQFNNLAILPNAEMGDPDYQKKYGMEIVETKIINIHGSLAESKEEISEIQQLVVATASMPHEDWVRTRAFCWMAAFLHFDKVMQIPFIVLHDVCGVSYRELFETFMGKKADKFPVISEIEQFFIQSGRDIQNGGPEYTHSAEWLDIFWPTDEYILIKLCAENKLTSFYREAECLLGDFLKARFLQLPPRLLHEAVELNRSLIKLPFQTVDLEVESSYNIWEFYRAALVGERIQLEERPCINRINRTNAVYNTWDDWYREVIWYGNKKGAYLYGNDTAERELAGHY
ncbi:MAG: radical SAM protein [Gammaproteobacteria bacterium]|nr:radical SAM protein [Gammaproteobacteria bacterium]MDH3411897.1 radical SAM protein [Gammaproteobacteria bacterium]